MEEAAGLEDFAASTFWVLRAESSATLEAQMQSYNRWKAALRHSAWLAANAQRAGKRIFISNLFGMDCIWFLD